ncbi:hypothetical protein BU15DRAFT_78087 [Melanogaster broomeanus]|nr:hypothetical protein BU15DRAFT_78087 [Melanogaster broomeanus]
MDVQDQLNALQDQLNQLTADLTAARQEAHNAHRRADKAVADAAVATARAGLGTGIPKCPKIAADPGTYNGDKKTFKEWMTKATTWLKVNETTVASDMDRAIFVWSRLEGPIAGKYGQTKLAQCFTTGTWPDYDDIAHTISADKGRSGDKSELGRDRQIYAWETGPPPHEIDEIQSNARPARARSRFLGGFGRLLIPQRRQFTHQKHLGGTEFDGVIPQPQPTSSTHRLSTALTLSAHFGPPSHQPVCLFWPRLCIFGAARAFAASPAHYPSAFSPIRRFSVPPASSARFGPARAFSAPLRLHNLSKLPRFSGTFAVGVSTQTGPGESASVPHVVIPPSLLSPTSLMTAQALPLSPDDQDSIEDLEEEEDAERDAEEASLTVENVVEIATDH